MNTNHNVKQPWSFCETPEENCTMNFCDENGCQNRQCSLANDPHADIVKSPTINLLEDKEFLGE